MESAIFTASKHLLAGGIIAYPTEAVWGFGCDPHNSGAIEKILNLKQRPVEKGLIIVAASMGQLGALVDTLPTDRRDLLLDSWPGPVTWLIPDPNNLYSRWVKGDHTTVAVRVSAHSVVRSLCEAFGGPIVSTSANAAGQPEIRSRLTLEQLFGDRLDFIVPGELGDRAQPSEIRDLMSGEVLR